MLPLVLNPAGYSVSKTVIYDWAYALGTTTAIENLPDTVLAKILLEYSTLKLCVTFKRCSNSCLLAFAAQYRQVVIDRVNRRLARRHIQFVAPQPEDRNNDGHVDRRH